MRGPGQPPPQRPAPINFPSARPCVWDRWVTAAWESPGHCPPPGRFFEAFSLYSNPHSPATGTDASKPPREEKLHADPGTGPKWTGCASLPGFGAPVLHPADIRPEIEFSFPCFEFSLFFSGATLRMGKATGKGREGQIDVDSYARQHIHLFIHSFIHSFFCSFT